MFEKGQEAVGKMFQIRNSYPQPRPQYICLLLEEGAGEEYVLSILENVLDFRYPGLIMSRSFFPGFMLCVLFMIEQHVLFLQTRNQSHKERRMTCSA